MKNTKFTKIAILILSVALLLGAAFAISTSATETSAESEILSDMMVNLKYGDNLYFLCLVNAEDLGSNADVRFSLYKDAACTELAASVKAEYLATGDVRLGNSGYTSGYYADFATHGVSATCMGVNYYVKAENKTTGESGEAVKCSVVKYLLERLYEDTITDLQRKHYNITLAYGSSAQEVTGDTKTNVANYLYVGAKSGEVIIDGKSVGNSAILLAGDKFTLKPNGAIASGYTPVWKDPAGNTINGTSTITASVSGVYDYTLIPMLTFDGMNSVVVNASNKAFINFGADYAAYNNVFKLESANNVPTATIKNEKLVVTSDDGGDYIRIYPTYTEEGYNYASFEADITINGAGTIYPVLFENLNAKNTVFKIRSLTYSTSTGELKFAATNASGGGGTDIKATLPTTGDNAHTFNLKIDVYDVNGDVLILLFINDKLSYFVDSRLVTDENVNANQWWKNTDGVPFSSSFYATYDGRVAGKETPFTKFNVFEFLAGSDFRGSISFDNVSFTQAVTSDIPVVNTTK